MSNLVVSTVAQETITGANRLCECCQNVFQAVSEYPRWPEGHVTRPASNRWGFPRLDRAQNPDNPVKLIPFHSIQSLMSSSLNGCHLCALIMTEMDPEMMTKLLNELSENPAVAWDQLKVMVWRMDLDLIIRLQESKVPPNHMAPITVLDFDYAEMNPMTSHYVSTFGTPSQSTASFETFNKIHHWLWGCNTRHLHCIERQARRFQLPSRLIYVGKFESRSVVKLVEANQLPTDDLERRYITLSHCWGTGDRLKLTTATHQEFRTGLDLERLPRTFRDAITLTRYLGINYIWIDCLCIIQDSVSDWETESYRMCDIYSGSFLNIGANAYHDSHGGLYQERNPLTVTPLKKILRWPPGWDTQKTVAFLPRSSPNKHIERGPLGGRGWVAQERLLAPRTIHFTINKVVWSCPLLTASETDVTANLETRGWTPLDSTWPALNPGLTSVAARANACLIQWDNAVRAFTEGDLTYQSDKLVAISGLAERLKTTWGDVSVQYLAGLWSYKIETALLWSTWNHKAEGRPGDQRAPSWSWAAVRGPILPRNKERGQNPGQVLCKVLDSRTSPISHPLGPVNGGLIRIRAPMCKVHAVSDAKGMFNSLTLNDDPIKFRELSPDIGGSFIPVNENHTVQSPELYLLGVWRDTVSDEISLEGLVLRRIQPESGTTLESDYGMYTRVGSWATRHENMTVENNWRVYEILGGAPPDLSRIGKDFAMINQSFANMNLEREAYQRQQESMNLNCKLYTITIV